MNLAANILIALVALEHAFIAYVELFAWETLGRKIFRGALPKDAFTPAKGLAANLGLYNGFLAAGLVWALCAQSRQTAAFFLICIAIAGVYAGAAAARSIFFKQALPALIALGLLWL